MKRIEIDSLSELPKVAREVVESLQGRSVVLLCGGMGAGKTTLVSRIAAYLGSEDGVTSPTFALVNQYIDRDSNPIYHFDLGYEEYFYSGDLCLVEWPEKIEALIPDDAMIVRIEVGDDEHRIFEIE